MEAELEDILVQEQQNFVMDKYDLVFLSMIIQYIKLYNLNW